MTPAKPTLAFTVDVEDWPQSSWDRRLPIGDYCAENARRVVDLFAEHPGARGTFFVLGKFAERHPQVVRSIQEAGHEVASHGYGHVELFHLGRDGFREDLRRSTDLLAGILGRPPQGYRAPDFSIVAESLWALEELADAGYLYDSSIFPIAKARYGIADWPRGPVRVRLPSAATIVEFPLASLELWGRRWPVGGGGYARLLPAPTLTRALRTAATQMEGAPVFYSHPYEVDPLEFRRLNIKIPLKVRWHQGLGRRRAAAKFRRLMREFDCISLGEALEGGGDLPTMSCGSFAREAGSVRRPPIFAGTRIPANP